MKNRVPLFNTEALNLYNIWHFCQISQKWFVTSKNVPRSHAENVQKFWWGIDIIALPVGEVPRDGRRVEGGL